MVVKAAWREISIMLDMEIGSDYVNLAKWWLSDSKQKVTNIVGGAVCWVIWKLRNDLHFQRTK